MAMIKNVEITPELREKLRSFAPIKAENEFAYTPRAYLEVPAEIRPKFRLRAIGGAARVLAQDQLRGAVGSDGTLRFNRGSFALSVCRGRILGWENYLDLSTGEEIPYDPTLEVLGEELIHELANEILDRRNNELAGEEKRSLG